jgi:hypothetical protein
MIHLKTLTMSLLAALPPTCEVAAGVDKGEDDGIEEVSIQRKDGLVLFQAFVAGLVSFVEREVAPPARSLRRCFTPIRWSSESVAVSLCWCCAEISIGPEIALLPSKYKGLEDNDRLLFAKRGSNRSSAGVTRGVAVEVVVPATVAVPTLPLILLMLCGRDESIESREAGGGFDDELRVIFDMPCIPENDGERCEDCSAELSLSDRLSRSDRGNGGPGVAPRSDLVVVPEARRGAKAGRFCRFISVISCSA